MLTETRIVLATLILLVLPGCGSMYLLQAARGQISLMNERRPIPRVVADPATPIELRAKLLEVEAARDFASEQLALPDNGSYKSYADIKRSFVVWNVVATPEFSVEPQRWCFPVAGCVAYRGYFSEQKARKFAARLKTQGFDVVVGGVPAYSTLGRFSDPVLNTMMGYGDNELAAIMFHELAHQLFYVPGDTAFNEAFAMAVEGEGLGRWLAFRGREAQLERYRERMSRQIEAVHIFTRRRAELARLYASKLEPEAMRERKRAIFKDLTADIEDFERRRGVRTGYRDWIEEGLNNAHLASVATYYDCVPGFQRLLAENGNDLTRFYAAVRELSRRPTRERRETVCGRQSLPATTETAE